MRGDAATIIDVMRYGTVALGGACLLLVAINRALLGQFRKLRHVVQVHLLVALCLLTVVLVISFQRNGGFLHDTSSPSPMDDKPFHRRGSEDGPHHHRPKGSSDSNATSCGTVGLLCHIFSLVAACLLGLEAHVLRSELHSDPLLDDKLAAKLKKWIHRLLPFVWLLPLVVLMSSAMGYNHAHQYVNDDYCFFDVGSPMLLTLLLPLLLAAVWVCWNLWQAAPVLYNLYKREAFRTSIVFNVGFVVVLLLALLRYGTGGIGFEVAMGIAIMGIGAHTIMYNFVLHPRSPPGQMLQSTSQRGSSRALVLKGSKGPKMVAMMHTPASPAPHPQLMVEVNKPQMHSPLTAITATTSATAAASSPVRVTAPTFSAATRTELAFSSCREGTSPPCPPLSRDGSQLLFFQRMPSFTETDTPLPVLPQTPSSLSATPIAIIAENNRRLSFPRVNPFSTPSPKQATTQVLPMSCQLHHPQPESSDEDCIDDGYH